MRITARTWARALATTAAIVLALPAAAQISYDTVSGTITSKNGFPYANARYQFQLVNPQGYPVESATTPNGQVYTAKLIQGELDANGTFTAQVPPNNILMPSNTHWHLTISHPAQYYILHENDIHYWTINYDVTVTGDVDLTSQLTALATDISFANLRTNQNTFGETAPQQITLQHNSLNVTDQSLFNALDDGTITPDSGYTLAKWLTNSTGGWAAEVPDASGQFQMQVNPPVAGQYVVVYPTAGTITASASSSGTGAMTATSGEFSWACTNGLGLCDIQAAWHGNWSFSGALEAVGVNPANVTSVYADVWSGYYPLNGGMISGGDADLEITCGSSGNLLSSTHLMGDTVVLTSLTGAQVDTATCNIIVGPSNALQSGVAVNAPSVRFIVYYTGTPVSAGSFVGVSGPAYLNTATNTLSVDPTWPFPGLNLLSQTAANRPTTPTLNALYLISDGASSTDCTTGGGTNLVLCEWNGSAWTAFSSGGGSSGFPVTLGSTSIASGSTTTSVSGLTVDGVTPTTFGFVDPTSSIQTQLNAKPTISGTPATGNCVDWASANTLGDTGSPCGSGGGGATFPATNGLVFNTSATASRNAAYTDIVPLWGSGSCSGYLKSDGTCSTPGGSIPSGTTNQLLYYAAPGTAVTPLTLGTNLSIAGGVLNAAGGGSGSPGGSTGNIQYNNAGAFGGDANTTDDGAGNLSAKTWNAASAGVFTSGAMHLNSQYNVNGLNFLSAFQANQPSGDTASEAVSVGMVVPSSSTVYQSEALGVYGQSSSTTTNAVSIYAPMQAMAANTKIWSMNPLVSDGGFGGVHMVAIEPDCNISSAGTTGTCVGVDGNLSVDASSFSAFEVNKVGSGTFGYGFKENDGCCDLAAYVGETSSAANAPSMPIRFSSVNSAGNRVNANISTNANGYLTDDQYASSVGLPLVIGTGGVLQPGSSSSGCVSDCVVTDPAGNQTITQATSSTTPLSVSTILRATAPAISATWVGGAYGVQIGNSAMQSVTYRSDTFTPMVFGLGSDLILGAKNNVVVRSGINSAGSTYIEGGGSQSNGGPLNVFGDVYLTAGIGTGSTHPFGGFEVNITSNYGSSSGTSLATGNVVCAGGSTTSFMTQACPVGSTNVMGIAYTTPADGNTAAGMQYVEKQGGANILLDGTQTVVVGDLICTSTTTAGKGHDFGAVNTCPSVTLGYVTMAGASVTSAAVVLEVGHNASGNSAIQTTVNCSTSGTAIFTQPAQGASNKQVNIYENACNGTASYTYPIAFTFAPQVLSQSLAATASASTTAVTITGSTSTGFVELQGW